MNKNKKGFTLIELLAVIVILAIIALIAVPVIMNVITKARISAFEDSAYGIVKAAELYYSNQLLEPEGMTEDQEFTITEDGFQNKNGEKLDISGSLPSSGKVMVTIEGKVALVVSNGEYYIQKATTEDEIKANSLKKDNVIESELRYKTAFVAASDGTEVPACITDNTTCSDEDIKNGLKVGVKVNDSETKDFYVISEDTEKGTITLIMNQNLGNQVAWILKEDYLAAGGTEEDWGTNVRNNKGPITALNALEDRTSSWTNIPSETYDLTDENNLYSPMTRTARARLITYSEAAYLGCAEYTTNTCPAWLYINTYDNGDNTTKGYWTSLTFAGNSRKAWFVYYTGTLHPGSDVQIGNMYGVRPVITISKSIL